MAYQYITEYNSPNYWDESDLAGYLDIDIESISIHHWGSLVTTFWGTVNWICRANGNSSAHEVIEAGRVAHLINLYRAAWHSGSITGNIKSYALELNPRASKSDYATAAERIADLWKLIGKKVPLRPHNYWTATACPGRWNLDRLRREAETWYANKYESAKPKPAPKPHVAPAPKTGLFWTVEPGDTLGEIANYYAIDVMRIADFNGIANPNVISVGQHIRIPGPLYWTVEPGDTVGKIADYYGLSVEALAANAGLRNADYIVPGQVLRVY